MRPALLALLLVPTLAQAVPLVLSHEGFLLDQNDQGLNATVSMRFAIHPDAQESGTDTALWSATYSVTVQAGYYSVLIGEGSPALDTSVFDSGAPRYLGVRVAGVELSPRPRIASTVYALSAGRAEVALDVQCAGCVGTTDVAAGAIGTTQVSSISGAKIDAASLPWGALAPLASSTSIANLDAATVGGHAQTEFARTSHTHSGAEITSGTISTNRLDLTTLDNRWFAKTGGTVSGAVTITGDLTAQGRTSMVLQSYDSTTFNCTGKDGQIFYDATLAAYFGCSGGTVKALATGSGTSSGTNGTQSGALKDCHAWWLQGARTSGYFWVDPNGGATTDAYEAYCDLQTSGTGWTRFNWATAALPTGGFDPLGVDSSTCSKSAAICNGRIPAGASPTRLLIKDTTRSEYAIWVFDASNQVSNAVLNAFRNKTTSRLANVALWAPVETNSLVGEWCGRLTSNCNAGCDSFYYDAANSGNWGLQLDDDTGYNCAAVKLGSSGFSLDDRSFMNIGTKDSFGELYWGSDEPAAGTTIRTDCQAWKVAGATTSGYYWIDPNGGATTDAWQAYCDLTTSPAGGAWTRFNWVLGNTANGMDPLAQDPSACDRLSQICNAHLPAGVTPTQMMIKSTSRSEYSIWTFNGSPVSNAVLNALKNRTASRLANSTTWAPVETNSVLGDWCGHSAGSCPAACDSFYYDQGNSSSWGLELDDDTGANCAAIKLGASNGATDDRSYMSFGIKDSFGEWYYR